MEEILLVPDAIGSYLESKYKLGLKAIEAVTKKTDPQTKGAKERRAVWDWRPAFDEKSLLEPKEAVLKK